MCVVICVCLPCGAYATEPKQSAVTNALDEIHHRYEALKIHCEAVVNAETKWQTKIWIYTHRNPDRLLPLEMLRRVPLERHSGSLPDITPPEAYEGVIQALATRRAQITAEILLLEEQFPKLTNQPPAVVELIRDLTNETVSEIKRMTQQTEAANKTGGR